MSCDSFLDCINDPIVDNKLPAENIVVDVSTTTIYVVNLSLFAFQVILFVAVVYFIFKGILSIIRADSSEAFEKFQGAITNAVFAAVGLVLLVGSRFIFVAVLRMVGIPDAENLFINLPF